MNNRYMRVGVLCLFALLFYSQSVYAERLGIAVDEGKVVFDMNADEEQTFTIKVSNVSDDDRKIELGSVDYAIGDDNQINFQDDITESTKLKEWITPSETEFTLPANTGKDVQFIVRTPQTAEVGSHRGAVIFRVLPIQETNVKIQGQIGVHVLINIKGDTKAQGLITKFDVPLFASRDVKYVAEFENKGNIHYVPHGSVNVRNVFTSKQLLYDMNESDHFVFPGKKYEFEITEPIPSILGLYRTDAHFVDGEGVDHTRMDFVMGYGFPAIFTAVFGIIWIVVRKARKSGARNKKSGLKLTDVHNEKEK